MDREKDGSAGARAKILVVEDEALISMLLCRELKKSGFDAVNKVTTAEEAIRQAEALEPDFIFMDIRLDGPKDGIDAAEAILEGRRGKVPIAFMTAYSSASVKERAMRLRPAAYLVKPINVAELKSVVEASLGAGS